MVSDELVNTIGFERSFSRLFLLLFQLVQHSSADLDSVATQD